MYIKQFGATGTLASNRLPRALPSANTSRQGNICFWQGNSEDSTLILCRYEGEKIGYYLSNIIGPEIIESSSLSMNNSVRETLSEQTTPEVYKSYDSDEYGDILDEESESETEDQDTIEEEIENSEVREKEERMSEEGETERDIPKVVLNYRENMHGVDSFNQLSSYYSFPHRSYKWYRTIIAWLIEVCINNAFSIYRKMHHQSLLTFLQFRMSIVSSWEEEYVRNKMEEEDFLQKEKEEEKMKKEGLKCQLDHYEDNRRGDCYYCSDRKSNKRVRTSWACLSCEIFVCPRCSIDHFIDVFHGL